MKVVLVIFFVILFFSCNDPDDQVNEDNDPVDSDAAENNNDSDSTALKPVCAEEWNKIEHTGGAVQEQFDFKVVKETGSWSWNKKGDFNIISYDGDIYPVHISDDGTIIADELTEVEEGYAFLAIFKKSGTFDRYVIKFSKGETIKTGSNDLKRHVVANSYYDEKNENIITVVSMRSGNGTVKPFLVKIDKDGRISYTFWKSDSNSYCSISGSSSDSMFLLCESWKNGSEPDKVEIYSLTGSDIYRKTIVSGINITIWNRFSKNDSFYVDYYVEYNDMTHDEIFAVDKDLCTEVKVDSDYFLTDYFKLKKQLHTSNFNLSEKFSFFSGVTNEYIYCGDSICSANDDFSYFNYGDSEMVVMVGPKKGDLDTDSIFFNFTSPGFDTIVEGSVYKSGSSTFDLEGKNRIWLENEGTGDEEISQKAYLEYIDPLKKEVFVRHFIYEEQDSYPGLITVKGDNIYFKPYAPVSGKKRTDLFKIPRNWLVSDEFKAKESVLQIYENDLERESVKEIKSIAGGGKHTCSVNEDGRPFCWGDNTKGQMGDAWGEIDRNDNAIITNNLPEPVDVSKITNNKKTVAISSGYEHSCAVDEDGRVFCWGERSEGRLGNGSFIDMYSPVFADETGEMKDKNIIQVSTGGRFSCALDEDSAVYCWGLNIAGQLGDGSTLQDRNDPMPIDRTGVLKNRKITSISSGSMHTCVIDNAGELFCWGSNDRGQLGAGSGGSSGSASEMPDISRVPVAVDVGGMKFVSVSAGYDYTCAVEENGNIYCFGNNSKGQLGDGTTVMSNIPVLVKSEKTFKAVSAGFEHTCAIDDKNEVYCWGSNIVGQLGTGSMENSLIPLKVKYENSTEIKSVSCGHRHTCSISFSGKVHCWGLNKYGQLGNGSYENSSFPEEIK